MFTLFAIVSNLYHKIRHDGEEWLLDSFIDTDIKLIKSIAVAAVLLFLVFYVVLKISYE